LRSPRIAVNDSLRRARSRWAWSAAAPGRGSPDPIKRRAWTRAGPMVRWRTSIYNVWAMKTSVRWSIWLVAGPTPPDPTALTHRSGRDSWFELFTTATLCVPVRHQSQRRKPTQFTAL